jgi:hypothetical protein
MTPSPSIARTRELERLAARAKVVCRALQRGEPPPTTWEDA